MKKKNLSLCFSVFLAVLSFVSCNKKQEEPLNTEQKKSKKEYSISGVLYTQSAVEYDALCLQAYTTAKYSLDRQLANYKGGKKPAVVFDIDETLLDNSPYFAWEILNDEEYSLETWKKWSEMAACDTVPGSVMFTKYAKSKGVETIYVSNRTTDELEATKKNMEKFGFPNVVDSCYYLKTETGNKEPRRQRIMEKYDILMLVGDNILDFNVLFEDKNVVERESVLGQFKHEFGERFIVLPNAMYGSWKTAMYGEYAKKPEDYLKRDSLRRTYLRAF